MNYVVVCIKHLASCSMPKKVFTIYLDFNKAIDELKSGIYIDSVKYGPEHIYTNINYFHMVFSLIVGSNFQC